MADKPSTPMFLLRTTYLLDPADVDAFRPLVAQVAQNARCAEGNVFLDAAQDVIEPNRFHLIEGWESKDHLDRALAGEAFQAILKQALALRILDRGGTIYFVAGVEALAMPT